MTREMKLLQDQTDGLPDLRLVSISVDPDTDTPSVLNQYAKRLNAPEKGWSFLTGKMEYLQRVGSEVYSVPLDKGTHVESFLVIDKWGVRRGKFAWNEADQIAEMRKLLPQLLAETSPPPPPKGGGGGSLAERCALRR